MKNKGMKYIEFSRTKKYELKIKLSSLAINAKNRLNQNKKLKEVINIKQKQISKYKENLSKLHTINSTVKNINELKQEIVKEIQSNNKELSSLNNCLKAQIDNLKTKYISLIDINNKDKINLKNKLNILKDRQFIYENALEEKENKLKNIKINLDKHYTFSEEETEILSDEDGFDSDEEFEKILNNNIDILNNKCFRFNKFKKNNNLLKKQISELKTKIKNLNKYINTLKNLNTNFDCIDFPNYRKIYIEGEECMEEKNEENKDDCIKENESNLEDSFLLTNDTLFMKTETEEDNDIVELAINDYFDKKTKLEERLTLPKLDLSLINYNKKKIKYEDKEKSLSRDNNCEQDIISIRINKMKNKINLCLDKKEILINKMKKYKQKIFELNNISKNIYTSPIYSFRIKSIKKRKFLFNSSFILTNNSLSKNRRNISSDKSGYMNNLKNFNVYL